MRKSIVPRLFFGVSAMTAIGVWVACGGSETQDVVATDAGADREERDTAPPPPPPPPPQDSGTKVDSGPVRDAGKEVILYPDGGPEAGIPCFEGGELEEEPNDLPVLANQLRPTRCGIVEVPDAGLLADGGESDWLTFQLSDASTGFFVYYEGNVRVFVETDGQAPVDISEKDASLSFHRGQPYYVQVKSKNGRTQAWKVRLFEDQ